MSRNKEEQNRRSQKKKKKKRKERSLEITQKQISLRGKLRKAELARKK